MVELGTRRTYRKGACRKLSTCRLRAPHFYPDPEPEPGAAICTGYGFKFGRDMAVRRECPGAAGECPISDIWFF
jgi:hypothetical protein